MLAGSGASSGPGGCMTSTRPQGRGRGRGVSWLGARGVLWLFSAAGWVLVRWTVGRPEGIGPYVKSLTPGKVPFTIRRGLGNTAPHPLWDTKRLRDGSVPSCELHGTHGPTPDNGDDKACPADESHREDVRSCSSNDSDDTREGNDRDPNPPHDHCPPVPGALLADPPCPFAKDQLAGRQLLALRSCHGCVSHRVSARSR